MLVVTEPAQKDVAPQELADLLWSTDPKLNGYMFGKMSTLHKLINKEWPDEHGLFSHKQAFTASRNGKVVGLLIGHTEGEYAANFGHSLVHQPQALEANEAAHLKSALHWMDRLFPAPRSNSYYILEFAVSPQAQGLGIASQLFTTAKAKALAQGCAQICLDVAADNEAVGFYQRLGFHTDVETRVPTLDDEHGIGLHRHMVCDLTDLE